MKSSDFQNFLFKSAIIAMSCDGNIEEKEINEIIKMADEEIYFMGYEYDQPLKETLNDIKLNGKNAINQYLLELSNINLSDKQELLLIEVLMRTIEADEKIHQNEIKFLHMVKTKLKTNEETLISRFPKQISYLIDLHNHGSLEEFNDEIKFE